MMNKRIIIELQELIQADSDGGRLYSSDEQLKIYNNEYPNILLDHVITDNQLNNAIDTIITAFQQGSINKIIVDLEERNRQKEPIREMTLSDIEDELGYKIKLINESEEE